MQNAFNVVFALHQPKKGYYDDRTPAIDEHFNKIREAEQREFSAHLMLGLDIVPVDDINAAAKTWKHEAAEYIALFGTTILNDEWLEAYPDRIINLHLGLSPLYRGSGTLLWPFVNGEPEKVGATIHLASSRVDAGPILEQIIIPRFPSDDYYSYTARLTRFAIHAMPRVVNAYADGRILPLPQDLSIGRNYRKGDFNEHVLKKGLRGFDEDSSGGGQSGIEAQSAV